MISGSVRIADVLTIFIVYGASFNGNEDDMDISAIVDEIRRTGNGNPLESTEKIRYVADKGKNTCRECLENDGKTFDLDDPELPQLPIHPNCRCKYVSSTVPQLDVTEDVERYRIVENLKKIMVLKREKPNHLPNK